MPPPQNPTDKKAAEAIREAQQRIQAHQAPLQEAITEHNARLEPSTGQPMNLPASAAGASSTAAGNAEEKEYLQAKLQIEAQERRLDAADDRFPKFDRVNNWARPTVDHRRPHEDFSHLQTEAQQTLERAGNTEPVGFNQRAGNTEHRLNPDAAEFHPGQQSGGQGGGGNQGQ